MAIPENLRRFRLMFGLTQRELGAIAGVTLSAVSNWEHGESEPKMGRIQKIADHYGLPKSVLLDDDGLARIDPDTRKLRQPVRPDSAISTYTADTRAPLYGTIAAGKPIETASVQGSYWVDPKVLEAHPHGFFLRVEGESMNRRFPAGCLAFVDPDAEVSSGDVAALWVNGYDAIIKRVLLGSSSVTLVPESYDPAYKDEIFDNTRDDAATIKTIGRVVWSVMPYGDRL
jgi:repressor LexA